MAALLGSGMASNAWSAVFLDDNFDAEAVPPGGWVRNDAAFINFDVVTGTVDLLAGGNPFGLVGSGTNSTGNVIDLDGSTMAGGTLQTKSSFAFNAGDVVTLSLDVGGNQRTGVDDLFAGFRFTGAPGITGATATGFGAPVLSPGMLTGTTNLDFTDPFQVFTISFTATSAGSVSAFVGTDSADNRGPLLDRVTLSDLAADIPEPASWALIIIGFGGIGGVLRRGRERSARA
jgi:hypothetical protein